jgi:hypothetical protein
MEHVRRFRGLTVPAFLELWARDAGVSVEDLVSCVKVRMGAYRSGRSAEQSGDSATAEA